MENDAYEQRIVAYADILGWSQASLDTSRCEALAEAINGIEAYADNFSPDMKQKLAATLGAPSMMVADHAGIEFSFFSDSFIVSSPTQTFKPTSVIEILSCASNALLRQGFLIRGGITVGDLYHRDRVIFGPALVEAVSMEQREAFYPRLLCSESFVTLLRDFHMDENYLQLDFDKSWIANIALGSWPVPEEIMKIIENKIINTPDIAHRRKWEYMNTTLPAMYDKLRKN